MPVNKYIEPVPDSKCELQAKSNMLFSSTAIANGTCTAVVTAIGMQTEVGNIHLDIQAAAEEDTDTPLKRKLNDFGELLAMVRCQPSFTVNLYLCCTLFSCPCTAYNVATSSRRLRSSIRLWLMQTLSCCAVMFRCSYNQH
jgi:magnesium-transporting ATPase (P-type)